MILLSTGALRFYGLDRVFSIAADLGFDGVEVIVDARWDTVDPLYLMRLSERYGLPITTVHSPFSFIEISSWGNDPSARMRNSIRLAEELGSEIVVIHLPFFAERRYARWMDEELPRAQEMTRVKLAVENMPEAYKVLGALGVRLNMGVFYATDRRRPVNTLLRLLSRPCFPGNSWDYLLRFRHLVLDTTHFATGGGDPVEAYEKMKLKLALIHLSNFDGEEHKPLGEGNIDFPRFLRHLRNDGYGGHLSVELMPDHFPDRTEPTARRILADNLALCRECLGAKGKA
ncbi:MAG: sugar phosphate isomerase/epimerase [Candidatus Aureabacteria bacterium]|nr:sugar phosphate isomerase/epimerase [Candidatus Auribacterota bacterium]